MSIYQTEQRGGNQLDLMEKVVKNSYFNGSPFVLENVYNLNCADYDYIGRGDEN